jgi:hypothetical protein
MITKNNAMAFCPSKRLEDILRLSTYYDLKKFKLEKYVYLPIFFDIR